ncbi:transmembrane protein 42-like [Gouania willdenowi]|uniref:Transmembrane protein 42-like n=1 Tax=Gouania willdenowi TaxID=441366 RepID=A0A8C5G7L2_GOUWI|nr:transmembrane protein 42-like [Gouania willdenowi]
MSSGSVHALLAGFAGSVASVCAKLTVNAHYLTALCTGTLHEHGTVCAWLHVPLRVLCGLLLLTFNTIMWTFFSKALRHCSSSARVTVTVTASNFISCGVLGRLFFGEVHAALWWAGIALTLCGLFVLYGSSPQALQQDVVRKEK